MTEHGIEVPSVIGTTRLGPTGIEELDELLEQAYLKGRTDTIREAIKKIEERDRPTERGRYAEVGANDHFNWGLSEAVDVLEEM